MIRNGLSYLPMTLVLIGLFYIHVHRTLITMTIEAESTPSTLYFSGVANPLATNIVVSNVSGNVSQVNVAYGDEVKKDQALYIIDTTQLQEQIQSSIKDLFKAKADNQTRRFQNNGNTQLYKLGLISKVSFMDSNSDLENSDLALDDAKQRLIKLLTLAGQEDILNQTLTLTKTADLQQLLNKPFRQLVIRAPATGVLLFPTKSLGNSTDAVKVTNGASIKEGQVLAVIGDNSGLIFEITVNENDFRNISIGQSANISGAAFPSVKLTGTVRTINRQANSSDADVTPMYTMTVVVPHLTLEQRKYIVIGMSAEVSFVKQNPPSIKIPIDAAEDRDGTYWVKIIDKNEQIKEVQVTPGVIGVRDMEILSGLSSGDRIVLAD